jgi:polysaccharide deacetylase family protein (PEP-CTERM system associated)
MERHILTVDVEDNFTYEELVNKEDWWEYENQVVENTCKIISLLRKYNATATFFVVGTVAERYPELIKDIVKNRHEIASHSYWHKSLKHLAMDKIEEDIRMSSELLSTLAGKKIFGYRAMGYSMPEDESEFYNLLEKYGYVYDSSKKFNNSFAYQTIQNDTISCIYPSAIRLFERKLIFSGGTYFRILPLFIVNTGIVEYRRRNQPVMIYIHPWEFNKKQPKRKVSLSQQILQSPITFTTERKLTYLLERYNFVSIREYLGV